MHARLSRVVQSKNERGGAGNTFLNVPAPWEDRGGVHHRFWKNGFFKILGILKFLFFHKKEKGTFPLKTLYKIDGRDPTSENSDMVQKISGRVAAPHSFGPPELLGANF